MVLNAVPRGCKFKHINQVCMQSTSSDNSIKYSIKVGISFSGQVFVQATVKQHAVFVYTSTSI